MNFLEDVTPEQRRAITHMDGPLLVVAGAGSGKTRVVARRVAHLIQTGVDPHAILAVTFTNKAAEEMGERVRGLTGKAGAQLSTFHSFCARVLRRHANRLGYPNAFSIFDTDDQAGLIKRIMKEGGFAPANTRPNAVRDQISRWKNDGLGPEDELPRLTALEEVAAAVYPFYSEGLRRSGAMDFDDLLLNALRLLRDDAEAREAIRDPFRYILIDEYQDTNPVQYELARRLAEGHHNLMATGDPDQSIYSWRGAAIENILNFTEDFPDATVVKLEANYRSRARILKIASKLIASNRQRIERGLVGTRGEGEPVELHYASSEETEASYLASKIAEMKSEGTPYNGIALIYRVNWLSRIYERAFRTARIPYRLIQGTEFYKRREIRDLVAFMRLVANPADEVSGARIINTPARGISTRTQARVAEIRRKADLNFISSVRAAAIDASLPPRASKSLMAFDHLITELTEAAPRGPSALIKEITTTTGLGEMVAGMDDGQQRVENMDELLNAAVAYEATAGDEGTLHGFLEEVALTSEADALDPTEDAVSLMTFHAAKGLEFDVVFMVAMEQGILPHSSNIDNGESLEEERRLAYVGITRARERLFLSAAATRLCHGSRTRQMPSQFISEIPSDLLTASADSEQYERPDETAEDFEEFAQSPARSAGGLKVGDMVLHSHFGVGRVKKIIGAGRRAKATIDFDTEGEMHIVLAFAQIQKLPCRR